MKTLLFIALSTTLLTTACKKDKDFTACMETKVNAFKTEALCPQGASVKEYTFQGSEVFVFNDGDCGADMAINVFNSNCQSLGFLGGISGNTKISGVEFSTAVYVKTIWEQ